MVSYTEVSTEITTNWAIAPTPPVPTIHDHNIQYSTKYPNKIFIHTYENMPMKPISQSNDAGLVLRKQFFQLYGVYDTYANAKLALQEIKRIITEKNGWYISGVGDIQKTKRRHIFKLPAYERAYLQKNEW